MNDFFKFYSGSLSGTIIVIILFLFIRFLLRKQSNHIKIMLWVILLIRLLFPVSIYTEYGILYSETFVEKNENLSAQEMKSDNSLQIFPKDENTSKPYMGKKKNINILMILWYIGLLVFAVYYIIQRIAVCRRTKNAKKISSQDEIYEWKESMACVIGLVKPKIFLPFDLSPEQRQIVLQHEKTHIKRKDYLLMMLYYIALALNWYNPLCWLIYFGVNKDIEMACDEQTLQNTSMEERKFYARTLLRLCDKGRLKYVSAMRPFICERSTLKMRIKNIGKEYSCQKTIYIVVASGLLLVVLFGSFLYKKIGLNNVDSKELARLASYKSTLNFDDTMPKIGYVGKGQLVVYDNMGVYVYDLSSSDLTDYVDFEKNHFKGLQGDDATFIHVLKDGRYIQLSDNEKQLQYDLKTKQQKNQLDKKESWNPKTEPMGVETAEYYSVSDVYYIGEGETCFLAINKNVTPNYGALLCVVSNAGAEKEYSLFD